LNSPGDLNRSTLVQPKMVRSGNLQPGKLVTHRFAMSDIMKPY
jgi:hypothetical protein